MSKEETGGGKMRQCDTKDNRKHGETKGKTTMGDNYNKDKPRQMRDRLI